MLLRYCLSIGTLGLSISAKPESIHIELTDKYIQELDLFWTLEMRQAAHNNSFQNQGGKESNFDLPSGHLHRRNPPTYSRDRSPPTTAKVGVEHIAGQAWVGWLYFHGNEAGKFKPKSCIASIVASPSGNLIATAAECVYDRRTGNTYDGFVFFPGGTHDMWHVESPCFHGQYKDGRDDQAARWNLAFARVAKSKEGTLGELYPYHPQPSFEDLPKAAESSVWMVQIWKPKGPPESESQPRYSGPSALLRCTYRSHGWLRKVLGLTHIFFTSKS
ncbi:hypothetical protein BCR37DRAFT_386830 [Protomyces lactucae-debilis]|uniref:Peptidase S1 domain-containing protein n=1 Tax=Protomyces lactucae-debilis TaxID=2754530 RepID=A0A1Y2FJR7_PROLT|nr:uncharacterized protein BCR37DRAFT_386830 [Protomyces lactucae-debilis]ORY83837.1 hypothetical protein BCR37DRAFT_386830 [Protomyces lactucae-debilis]